MLASLHAALQVEDLLMRREFVEHLRRGLLAVSLRSPGSCALCECTGGHSSMQEPLLSKALHPVRDQWRMSSKQQVRQPFLFAPGLWLQFW